MISISEGSLFPDYYRPQQLLCCDATYNRFGRIFPELIVFHNLALQEYWVQAETSTQHKQALGAVKGIIINSYEQSHKIQSAIFKFCTVCITYISVEYTNFSYNNKCKNMFSQKAWFKHVYSYFHSHIYKYTFNITIMIEFRNSQTTCMKLFPFEENGA